MSTKPNLPDYPISYLAVRNDMTPAAVHAENIDLMQDRLATANRRMAIPVCFQRPVNETFNTGWEISIPVPPYTMAVGVRARGISEREPTNEDYTAKLFYKWSTDVTFTNYLEFDQASQGVDSIVSAEHAYSQSLTMSGDSSLICDPTNADPYRCPLPVTVSNEWQDLTICLEIDTDLSEFAIVDVQFFYIPYADTLPALP